MHSGGDSFSDFGQWWDDPKKHYKRMNHWLPHLRGIASRLKGSRGIRYFSLCARHMIDVFMLVDEKLLIIDANGEIHGVQYCEMLDTWYTEIRQIVARESSGFYGRLEDVALFQDTPYTQSFKTIGDIERERLKKGEELTSEQLAELYQKETSLQFRGSFPYDYINLDFCGYYYDKAPDVFRITDTVSRFLDWQRDVAAGADPVKIDDFILCVTCKYGDDLPADARTFLDSLIRSNAKQYSEYSVAIEGTRGVPTEQWIGTNPEDTFLAAWPKHIASEASKLGWQSDILDYVYYHRPPGSAGPYIMICLVLHCTRAKVPNPSYLKTALYALNRGNRKEIADFAFRSKEGKPVYEHLERVRLLRNAQARSRGAAELPRIRSA